MGCAHGAIPDPWTGSARQISMAVHLVGSISTEIAPILESRALVRSPWEYEQLFDAGDEGHLASELDASWQDKVVLALETHRCRRA
jgi:hypothetical protein